LGDLFPSEPDDYYKPPPQPTIISFTREHATIPYILLTS
jgi:hypothetical protein